MSASKKKKRYGIQNMRTLICLTHVSRDYFGARKFLNHCPFGGPEASFNTSGEEWRRWLKANGAYCAGAAAVVASGTEKM